MAKSKAEPQNGAPVVRVAKLSEFMPDPNNINLHTQRGQAMLEASLRERGFARPMFASGDGRILGGNLTSEVLNYLEMGEQVIVIETDGHTPIIHVRKDLTADDPEAQRLALEDNRISQVSFNPDVARLAALAAEQPAAVEGLYYPDELAALVKLAEPSTVNLGFDEAFSAALSGGAQVKGLFVVTISLSRDQAADETIKTELQTLCTKYGLGYKVNAK